MLEQRKGAGVQLKHYPAQIQDAVRGAHATARCGGSGLARRADRRALCDALRRSSEAVTTELGNAGETFSDKLDRVLTHKVWGTLIFVGIMAVMFQSIFTFARFPMDALQAGVDWLGNQVGRLIPPGDLNSLLVDGVIAGRGRGDRFSAADSVAVSVHRTCWKTRVTWRGRRF